MPRRHRHRQTGPAQLEQRRCQWCCKTFQPADPEQFHCCAAHVRKAAEQAAADEADPQAAGRCPKPYKRCYTSLDPDYLALFELEELRSPGHRFYKCACGAYHSSSKEEIDFSKRGDR